MTTLETVDWADFFKRHEDYTVAAGFYECKRDFSLEELYQAFKARLMHEMEEYESKPYCPADDYCKEDPICVWPCKRLRTDMEEKR